MEVALSVVVCTHNNAGPLAGALRALAAQEDAAGVEILVIDNNCTDATADVVAAANLPGLRRIVEPRQGQAFARVRGVREARGEWIAFVDDDNELEPGWLRAAAAFIAAHPKAGAFGGRVIIDWETPPPPAVARRAWAYAATDLGGAAARRLEGAQRWKLRGAGLVCRKAPLVASGWLDWQACVGRVGRGALGGDDTEILLRIAREGAGIWYEPACALRHRIAARRIGEAQLLALCRGFATADAMLLGLEHGGGLAEWAARFGALVVRRLFALARHSLGGLFSADARMTARLTLLALVASGRGLGAVWRLTPAQRAAWLGRTGAADRVLHLFCGRNYGGIQRLLACLGAERAHCPGLEPVFGLCAASPLSRELTRAGVRVEMLGGVRASRPWLVPLAAWRLRRLLRQQRYAAVVCHGSPTLAFFGWAIRRAPLVLWMHNDTKVRHANLIERVAGWNRPRLVICNSAFTAASLPLLFAPPAPRHAVVACPVSPPGQVAPRAQTRASLGAAPGTTVIALAGRPEPWKGHALLLEAVGRLREVPDWTVWLIGGPFHPAQAAYLETLRELARASGIAERVQFLGQRDDVSDLLAAADIFCQPNRTPEPFGIVFVEALYAGLPVVTCDHGGATEIVDANCGRLVPPDDAPALAAALEELIRQPERRRTLGAAAPARGRAVSDPARILPQMHALLASLHG